MRWMRRRLGVEALTTVLLFVAGIASPRAGFVAHSHGGGEHEHVHLDDGAGSGPDAEIDRLLAEALGSEALHHHRHHHLQAAGGAAGIENPDTPATWHWHVQSPLHRAIIAGALTPAVRTFIAGLPEFTPLAPATTAVAAPQARAPPALA